MAADLTEIERMIADALPGARVSVIDETGTGDHLRASVVAPQFEGLARTGQHLLATVRAPQFEGLSRIDQHRLVKAAVKARFDDGTIHALSVKTELPR